ncbi:MAG: hypothetical protein ACREIV_10575 [Planctomycetaceae bacterium]
MPEPDPQAEEPPQQESIIGKTTQEIGKYDPAAGRVVSDSKIHATNPVTAPLEAYGPMLEKVSATSVEHHLNLYYAEHGRYPTYDEFMEQIIKRNNLRLPVLPGGSEYQYDEANHRLVVVEPVVPAE